MDAQAPQLKCLGALRALQKFYLGDHLLSLGTPAKMLGSLNGSLKIFLRAQSAPCSYWKSDTLPAIVECGSAFIEDISKARIQMLVNYPILLTYMVVILM